MQNNEVITIIVGTNAHSGTTRAVASAYEKLLSDRNIPHQLCDLQNIPQDIIAPDMYFNRSDEFLAFQDQYLVPTNKYIIVIPEYNGGVPGIFKLMIDCSDITTCWWGKKACLTGVASGRSGNLRGLDTLTNYLNYLKVDVLKNKIPISKIDELVQEGQLTDESTLQVLEEQLDQYLAF